MSRRALVVGGLVAVALVVAAAVALVLAVDPERYRGQLVAAVERASGREVTIAGPLELEVLPFPRLAASDLTLANAEWGSQPHMLAIGRVEATVDPLALVGGRLEILRLDLDDTELLLETAADGRANWRIAGGDITGPVVALRGDVAVRNLAVTWQGPGGPLELTVPRLDLTAEDRGAAVELAGEVRLRGETVAFSGTLTDLADLSAGRPLELAIVLEARDTDLELSGRVAEPLAAAGLDLALKGQGDGVAAVAALAGADLPAIGPWALEARVTDIEGGLRLAGLAAEVAEGRLTGDLDLALEAPRPRLAGHLEAAGLRLPGPAGKGSGEPGRVFGPTPLPVAALGAVDLDIEIAAEDIAVAGVGLQAASGTVSLAGGRLQMEQGELRLADSVVSAELTLEAGAEPPTLSLRLAADAIDMARLQELLTDRHWLSGRGRMELEVTARGRSPAALAASLDGAARLLVEEGEASTEDLDAVVGGLTRLVGTLVAEDEERARLNCAAADFKLEQGVATARVLMADTEHSTVYGEGTVDLGEERLDLLFTPKPKTITLSVAVPVEVGGSLTSPSYSLEKVAVTRKAIGVLAAVGLISFPPAALLGLTELDTGPSNPCIDIAREHREQAESAKGGESGNPLDAIGEGLKGLFGD